MAIHACEFGGEQHAERALAYVRTMGSASGLKPRAKQYELAIKAMVAARRYRDAYQLLAEAVEVSWSFAEEGAQQVVRLGLGGKGLPRGGLFACGKGRVESREMKIYTRYKILRSIHLICTSYVTTTTTVFI